MTSLLFIRGLHLGRVQISTRINFFVSPKVFTLFLSDPFFPGLAVLVSRTSVSPLRERKNSSVQNCEKVASSDRWKTLRRPFSHFLFFPVSLFGVERKPGRGSRLFPRKGARKNYKNIEMYRKFPSPEVSRLRDTVSNSNLYFCAERNGIWNVSGSRFIRSRFPQSFYEKRYSVLVPNKTLHYFHLDFYIS